MTPMTARFTLAAAASAAGGWALFALGVATAPQQAMFSYLAAFGFTLSIAVGALIFVMLAHVTRGRWFVVLRRFAEALTATLPLLALLFVPLYVGRRLVYPWARDRAEVSRALWEAIEEKRSWLSPPAFGARAAVYFAIFVGLAMMVRGWSVGHTARVRAVSAGGLPILALAFTFACFDWLMSIEPAWSANSFGVYVFAGGFLATLGVIAMAAYATREARPNAAARPSASHSHALGNLLLTFVAFWAYIAFSQLLVIWLADLPEEVAWYRVRWAGGWHAVAVFLVVGHFVVPFFALLMRPLKRASRPLAIIGAWVVVAHAVDMHFLVLPALHDTGFQPHWLDLAALVAVAGSAVAFASWRYRAAPPIAADDPELAAALRFEMS